MPVLTLPGSPAHSLSVRAKALVFEDPKSKRVLERIDQIAPSQATVLITGETGTGKEIVARHVHALSSRANHPFIAVNCGALSETIIESELFGHDRGAFTGAVGAKAGWFEAADGGTLFLDEIGDLPLHAQVKLLRVLQESEVVRVGSRRPIPIDVRLIAATNVDLTEAVAAGHFRGDLYYRLNVATVALPPLRERAGDILPLAQFFLELYQARLQAGPVELSPAASSALLQHSWPGNIRELENVVHHALLVCREGRVTPQDLPLSVISSGTRTSAVRESSDPFQALGQVLDTLFEQAPDDLYERIEEAVFRSAYLYCERNQLQTARLLGISRNIVRARLIQFGDLRPSVRPPSESSVSSNLSSNDLSSNGLGSNGDVPRRARDSEPPSSMERPTYPGASRATLRIGYQSFGLLPLVKASQKLEQAFALRDLSVEWSAFDEGNQLINGFVEQGLSFGMVGEGPPVVAEASRVPLAYVAAEGPWPEGEGIVVPPHASDILSVRDLRGRRVALNRAGNTHYLLIRALEEAGVDYDEITPVFLAPPEARHAFERGEVDAWVVWEPWLSHAQLSSDGRILRDGQALVDNTAYYITSPEIADSRPDLIEVFLSTLEATVQWANQEPDEAAALLAQELELSEEAVRPLVERVSRFRPLDAAGVESQQRIADAFHKHNLITRAIRIADTPWVPPRWRPSTLARVSVS